MLARTAADRRRAEGAQAVAVLLALRRAGGMGGSFAMLQLERRLANGAAALFRARYAPSGELRVLPPTVTRDVTFLAEHFGYHRVLVVETAAAEGGAEEVAPPRELHVDELRYELVAAKPRKGKGEPMAWHFVATSGGPLPPICLATELQRVANFAAVTPTSKLAARLELLCSRGSSTAAMRMDATMLAVRADLSPVNARGAAMADGCGFAPDWLVTRVAQQAGALQPELASALQVRVYSPKLGIFKGMLMRRPGLETVQLVHSMRKVPPCAAAAAAAAGGEPALREQAAPRGKAAVATDEGVLTQALRHDEALLLVKLVHPTRTNLLRASARLAPPPPAGAPPAQQPPPHAAGAHVVAGGGWLAAQAERVPAPPSEMVLRLWAALGLSQECIDAYAHSCRSAACISQLSHASLSGVADPFASLPAGSVFAPGIDGSRLFVTRFPCVKPSDGRIVPLVSSRPQSMLASQWAWLQTLPFGLLVFSVRGERPLPEICGDGDLDGDLYFACWDELAVLRHLSPRDPSPNPRRLPSRRRSSRADAAGDGSLDLRAVHAYLADRATLQAPLEVGRIFRLWEATVASKQLGMDDPDALLLADAYLGALNAGKHGDDTQLPLHLRKLLEQPVGARRRDGAQPRRALSGRPVSARGRAAAVLANVQPAYTHAERARPVDLPSSSSPTSAPSPTPLAPPLATSAGSDQTAQRTAT